MIDLTPCGPADAATVTRIVDSLLSGPVALSPERAR